MQQLLNDVLNVFAHVAGFGQRGGVGHHKRHIERACQGLGQQGLARTRGSDQQDIAFCQFDIVFFGGVFMAQALVMVVNRDGQRSLGRLLANDVTVQGRFDLSRGGQIAAGIFGEIVSRQLIANDFIAQVNAFVTDKHGRTRNEFFNLVLALSAEGAVERFFA